MFRRAAASAILLAALTAAKAAPPMGGLPTPTDLRPPKAPPGQLMILTAEQDRRRLLDLLHIKSMRPVPSTIVENPVLPDPLKTKSGKAVSTSDIWWQERRQEIADDFESAVYGRTPDDALSLEFKPVSSVTEKLGKLVVSKQVLVGHLYSPTKPPISVDVRLTVTLPKAHKGPVPVVLLLSSGEAPAALRAQVLARGWAAASLDVSTIQANNGAGLTQGVIGVFNNGHPRELNNWGVLRAWVWGASRVIDYFENDPAFDSAHIAVAGHADQGKAALLAMAFDARFAVAYVSSSGPGGADLFRRQPIEALTASDTYHFFDGEFLKYGGPKTANDLPVDGHELFALCAPRPVFVSTASQGDDPRGAFLAMAAAGPVYRVLGKKGLGTDKMPPAGKAVSGGELAFRQHPGNPSMEADWPLFLTYAQRYLVPLRKKP
ncbi:MAG: acetylxylan esterase [Proteobacteria bacterium]|nr:acetylxylan esterase [Pseudomonadota bacterium]